MTTPRVVVEMAGPELPACAEEFGLASGAVRIGPVAEQRFEHSLLRGGEA